MLACGYIEETHVRTHERADLIQLGIQAHNVWRTNILDNPGLEEFKCPYKKRSDMGGEWVTLDHCQSCGQGSGCRDILTCKARIGHMQARRLVIK